MKVLVLDEEFPYPPNSGKRIRTFSLVKRLAERHSIMYLSRGAVTTHPEISNITLRTAGASVPRKSGPAFYAKLLFNLFSPLPYVVASHYSKDYELRAQELAAAADVIHCEWTPYSYAMRGLFPCSGVLAAHNVESKIWERYYINETNPIKKAYCRIQWKKMVDFENWAWGNFSHIAVVSELDKQFISSRLRTGTVTVVPNGVDVEYFQPQVGKQASGGMVFTGAMDWRPNQDAVKFFLNDIYPKVCREVRGAEFVVVGRNPPAWLQAQAKKAPGVSITGTVEDVRPYLASAALFVVPLRVGGGSRLKILEALAMGKTVISTSIGAEGLEVKDAETILIRDDPDDFAACAVEVLKHPEKFSYLGKNGRDLVTSIYSWDAIANMLERVWNSAAGR